MSEFALRISLFKGAEYGSDALILRPFQSGPPAGEPKIDTVSFQIVESDCGRVREMSLWNEIDKEQPAAAFADEGFLDPPFREVCRGRLPTRAELVLVQQHTGLRRVRNVDTGKRRLPMSLSENELGHPQNLKAVTSKGQASQDQKRRNVRDPMRAPFFLPPPPWVQVSVHGISLRWTAQNPAGSSSLIAAGDHQGLLINVGPGVLQKGLTSKLHIFPLGRSSRMVNFLDSPIPRVNTTSDWVPWKKSVERIVICTPS